MTTETERDVETIEYGRFADLLKPDSKWVIGGFPGWEFREPNAVAVVQNGRLRVAAVPLTRSNAMIQFFDNAKHIGLTRPWQQCNRSSQFVLRRKQWYKIGKSRGGWDTYWIEDVVVSLFKWQFQRT